MRVERNRNRKKGVMSMRVSKGTTGVLAAAALLLVAGAAGAAEFDRAMEPILTEYLEIHAALAADEINGVGEAVRAIEDLVSQLDPNAASGEHAEHYESIPKALLAACEKLERADDIGAMRDAFADLFKPISMWVTMAKPKGMSVMYCPMRKAGWVQRGSEVANPYYGAQMLGCGEKVVGSD
jgi:Cu(I)/Ag(I) efflux system membrane fusion protein